MVRAPTRPHPPRTRSISGALSASLRSFGRRMWVRAITRSAPCDCTVAVDGSGTAAAVLAGRHQRAALLAARPGCAGQLAGLPAGSRSQGLWSRSTDCQAKPGRTTLWRRLPACSLVAEVRFRRPAAGRPRRLAPAALLPAACPRPQSPGSALRRDLPRPGWSATPPQQGLAAPWGSSVGCVGSAGRTMGSYRCNGEARGELSAPWGRAWGCVGSAGRTVGSYRRNGEAHGQFLAEGSGIGGGRNSVGEDP